MKERTFTSFEQYERYLKKKMMNKAKCKGLEGDAYVEYLQKHENDAARIWKENDLQKWLEKDGYVTITVWRDETGQRKIGRGRPKKPESEKLKHSIHVRLDDERYKKLTHFCTEKNIDVSEAIRILINNL
ncbi:hypothetical protein [Rossellomorea sp. BNER]|uniref:hypothetical protein n=1 Tax=Rossellomorea sp. BNER TaxID=2962031 RepID=UPI003AF286B9|nr:hypothetical protein [Rossellomorea sp. BNER]